MRSALLLQLGCQHKDCRALHRNNKGPLLTFAALIISTRIQ
uniref:Uncharacterized protein n=1 Tax=Setaria italica TaxID=4555 RepID=K3ZGE6_SETIT